MSTWSFVLIHSCGTESESAMKQELPELPYEGLNTCRYGGHASSEQDVNLSTSSCLPPVAKSLFVIVYLICLLLQMLLFCSLGGLSAEMFFMRANPITLVSLLYLVKF